MDGDGREIHPEDKNVDVPHFDIIDDVTGRRGKFDVSKPFLYESLAAGKFKISIVFEDNNFYILFFFDRSSPPKK